MPMDAYSLFFLMLFLCISTFFSFLINWLFLRFSFNLGTRESITPGQVRWSSTVKPSIGGISFFILFLVSISVLATLPRENNTILDRHLIGIMAASSLGFILGLADDAYNTNPLAKFIMQLSCSFILIVSDVYINATGMPAVDFILTTVWVIGLMNSINMLDNMDAITASISAIIIAALIGVVLVVMPEQATFYLVLLVGVLGSLLGFLYFNWNPSRIYMGDTGSQFLGVFLAALSILFFWNFRDDNSDVIIQFRQFVIPMLIFIVPLVDTTTVTIRRLMRKQSPFVGGKDHITHHLAYLGLKDRWVAIVLISVSLLSLPMAWALVTGYVLWTPAITVAAFGYFAFVFVVFQLLYNMGKKQHESKLAAAAKAQ